MQPASNRVDRLSMYVDPGVYTAVFGEDPIWTASLSMFKVLLSKLVSLDITLNSLWCSTELSSCRNGHICFPLYGSLSQS